MNAMKNHLALIEKEDMNVPVDLDTPNKVMTVLT